MTINNCYSKRSRAVQVNYCKGETTGLREVASLGAIALVRAGPWSERDVLKKTAPFYAYALATTAKAYFGSGTCDRALGDRLTNEERAQIEQVHIIHSPMPCFDRSLADKVEHRLLADALETGMPVFNKCLPFGRDGLRSEPGFEELMIDVRLMLAAAGFTLFDQHDGKAKRSRLAPANTIIDAVRYIDPDDWVAPEGGMAVRIAYRDLRAEGYRLGKRRILVAPGADWYHASKSSLSEDNRRRRQDIETAGKLDPNPDRPDRARLRIGLDCTAAIAAKLLTGEHIDSDVWQPVSATAANGHSEG